MNNISDNSTEQKIIEAAETVFHEKGFDIVGLDNDMRSYFFGKDASTAWNTEQLKKTLNKI